MAPYSNQAPAGMYPPNQILGQMQYPVTVRPPAPVEFNQVINANTEQQLPQVPAQPLPMYDQPVATIVQPKQPPQDTNPSQGTGR